MESNTAADDNEVEHEFGLVRVYKSGRVVRPFVAPPAAPGLDPATGVDSKDVHLGDYSARLYLPPSASAAAKLPVIVYVHGGGFVAESVASPNGHRFLNSLAAACPALAVSVEYRLAPEHPLPAAYDDSWAALNWVIRNAGAGPEPWLWDRGNLSRLFLAGDSAGANIVHNMAMRAGNGSTLDRGAAIRGILLLDPYFWGKRPVGAETTDPATRRQYEVTWSFVCAGRYGIDDPRIDPLATPPAELRRLACSRVAVTVSGLDDFEARGKAYAAALNGSGWAGEVVQYETAGERHVYFLDAPASPKSAKELAFAAGYLSRE